MILIIGGAYQGKLEFAKSAFGVTEEEIFRCQGAEMDLSKRCICSLEAFTYAHPDPVGWFQQNREAISEHIFIIRDISGGVVPLGADNRAWRQKNGRLCQYLAKQADQVSRIFCGLEQRLK